MIVVRIECSYLLHRHTDFSSYRDTINRFDAEKSPMPHDFCIGISAAYIHEVAAVPV